MVVGVPSGFKGCEFKSWQQIIDRPIFFHLRLLLKLYRRLKRPIISVQGGRNLGRQDIGIKSSLIISKRCQKRSHKN